MGINIFALVKAEQTGIAKLPLFPVQNPRLIADEVNERYGNGVLFDWCDLFKGDEQIMTPSEARALPDDSGPCFVYDTASQKMHRTSDPTGTVPDRNKWQPLMQGSDTLIVFLKARL